MDPPTPSKTWSSSDRGLLSCFDKIKIRPSFKKIVHCKAAQPECATFDFLRAAPSGEFVSEFVPISSTKETRFHRGFHRRPAHEIQSDRDRLQRECDRDAMQSLKDQLTIEAELVRRSVETFNLLSGQGRGRELEGPGVGGGLRIVNPRGRMEEAFATHDLERHNRQLAGKHRFFEGLAPSQRRAQSLATEGLVKPRESLVIGNPRDGGVSITSHALNALQSRGVSDNFAHSQLLPLSPRHAPRPDVPRVERNKSQIVFG